MVRINRKFFEDLYRLNECKVEDLLEYFRQNKNRLYDTKTKNDTMNDLYNFFCIKTNIFETDDCKNATYVAYINSLIDKVRKGIDGFNLEDLRKCLFYFFLSLFSNSDKNAIKLDCVWFGNQRRNYTKLYKPYYKSLDYFLKEYIEFKTNVPNLHLEDLSQEEFEHIKSVFEKASNELNQK